MTRSIRSWVGVLGVLIAVLIVLGAAVAGRAQTLDWQQVNEIRDSIRRRLSDPEANLSAELKSTPNGYEGSFMVETRYTRGAVGDLASPRDSAKGAEEVAREVVTQQLQELYVLPEWGQLRTNYYDEKITGTHVVFGFYVAGIPLEGFYLRVMLRPDYTIISMSGGSCSDPTIQSYQ